VVYFWYILTGTNLSMFFLSAILGRKDLMLLNAVSMFSCLFMAHVSHKRRQLKDAELLRAKEDE
jgi:hypothetical protein